MSFWTHITGSVTLSPVGRTQHEKRYVLETVLDHLPRVTGSEGDMNIHIVQRAGYDSSFSVDELGDQTNNLTEDLYGYKNRKHGWLNTQSEYILVLEADLRDRMFEETFRELQKWLCRLAKRVMVQRVLVSVHGYDKSVVINEDKKYYDMYECTYDGEENWCDYLLWKRADSSSWPIELLHKYHNDPEIEVEYRRKIER